MGSELGVELGADLDVLGSAEAQVDRQGQVLGLESGYGRVQAALLEVGLKGDVVLLCLLHRPEVGHVLVEAAGLEVGDHVDPGVADGGQLGLDPGGVHRRVDLGRGALRGLFDRGLEPLPEAFAVRGDLDVAGDPVDGALDRLLELGPEGARLGDDLDHGLRQCAHQPCSLTHCMAAMELAYISASVGMTTRDVAGAGSPGMTRWERLRRLARVAAAMSILASIALRSSSLANRVSTR